MSEKTVENGTADATKPIIITKSIKSLTEPAAPSVVRYSFLFCILLRK